MELPGAFVLGSNDYYGPIPKNPARYLTRKHAEVRSQRIHLPVDDLVSGMRAGGWHDLDNTRTTVTMGDHRVELVGVDDPHIQRDRYADVAGPASSDVALTMGLVHAPYQRVLDAMVADGADLVLAGHTHGGQLAVPLWGALVTNCDLDRRRAKGMSRWWPGAGSAGPDGGAARLVGRAAGRRVAARLGRPRHLALRPRAVRLPSRGDPAHPPRPRRLSGAPLDRAIRQPSGRAMVGRRPEDEHGPVAPPDAMPPQKENVMRRRFAIAVCAVAVMGASAGGAMAGEVKGPPGTVGNTNTTGALDHARSACAASGLNDLDPLEGQTVSQVQTAADSWRYYGLPHGAPGRLGLCRGNG